MATGPPWTFFGSFMLQLTGDETPSFPSVESQRGSAGSV